MPQPTHPAPLEPLAAKLTSRGDLNLPIFADRPALEGATDGSRFLTKLTRPQDRT